MMLNVIVNQ